MDAANLRRLLADAGFVLSDAPSVSSPHWERAERPWRAYVCTSADVPALLALLHLEGAPVRILVAAAILRGRRRSAICRGPRGLTKWLARRWRGWERRDDAALPRMPRRGRAGLEFLVGLPGCVGGGDHECRRWGSEIQDVPVGRRDLEGNTRRVLPQDAAMLTATAL